MKPSLERKLSNLKQIDFDLEEEITDEELEKIYGGKTPNSTVDKQDTNQLRRPRFRDLWYFFFRFFKI